MSKIRFFLSSPPDTAAEAARAGEVSLMAYRVGRSFRLVRAPGPDVRASVMDVDCSALTGYGPHLCLAAELTRECRRMGCSGISLDLPRPTPQLTALCALLDEEAARQGLRLFVPERYALACPGAAIRLPAQNFSGTYDGRLEALARRWGPERLAPELERVRLDFALPARTGLGSALPWGEPGPEGAFYSPELRANYRTSLRAGRAHLVLWDDTRTLREKITIAVSLGITHFFLYYPHFKDILPEITP